MAGNLQSVQSPKAAIQSEEVPHLCWLCIKEGNASHRRLEAGGDCTQGRRHHDVPQRRQQQILAVDDRDRAEAAHRGLPCQGQAAVVAPGGDDVEVPFLCIVPADHQLALAHI